MPTIQPLTFPIIGDAVQLTILILNFTTDAVTCTTYYKLTTVDDKMCLEGNYTLTEQEYNDWGEDNSYIDQIIANLLGVTII